MSISSLLQSPAADAYWYWASNIVGVVAFATIIGESVKDLPQSWLPARLRSAEAHHVISKRSWAVLAIAILLEVAIEMARDSITATAMSHLEHATRAERVFTNESEAQRLVAMLRVFADNKYSVIVDSADGNPNSEQARFGQQLRRMLDVAGWERSNLPALQRIWAPNANWGMLIEYRADSAYSRDVLTKLIADFAAFDTQASGDSISDLEEHTFSFEVGIR
jgi:hypothetical protein